MLSVRPCLKINGKEVLLLRKRTAYFAIILILVVAAFAAGCTGADAETPDYDVFYARNNGAIDETDWYAIGGGKWEDAARSRGIFVRSGTVAVFYDATGNERLFEGTLDGGILSVKRDGETKYYYSADFSENSVIGINTVYALATELGFEGTLQDLIDAFKGDDAYAVAVKNGYTGTETEWLASLIGAKGDDGTAPEIKDGFWYVGDVNTGVKATGEQGEKGDTGVGITGIEKISSDGTDDLYRITYSDNSTYNFTVKNGRDGKDGVSVKKIEKSYSEGNVDTYTITMSDDTFYTFEVTNGKDADYDLTVSELFAFMQSNGYEGGYEDFIRLFAPSAKDLTFVTKALLSSVSVTAKATVTSSAGSGIIYSIDKEKGDAIVLTNYHVIYNDYATDGEEEYCSDIKVYLYGSEVTANGLTAAQEMGITAEFIGGSKYYDVAVLKIRESELIKNSIALAAEFTDSDKIYVGQDIIAVGNAENEGISVTEGIVSLASENIVMQELGSGDYISRRVIRIDAPVSPGNSGGGAFDTDGKLVGLVDAKRTEELDEGIGYAIPSNVVKAIARNILAQYAANPTVKHRLYRPLIGMTIFVYSSQARIDETTGIVYIDEKICVDSATPGSLCDGKFLKGDFILSIKVGAGEKKTVNHIYTLTDAVMCASVGDEIEFGVERDGTPLTITVTVTQAAMSYAN